MIKNRSNLIKGLSILFVICSFCAAAFAAKALTVQEKLEKGQSLYEAGQYDAAMDNFLDVFVEGNIEQINIANEYVNMIHFKRGGVSTPTRVIYDEQLEAQKEAYKQEAKDIQKEIDAQAKQAEAYTKQQYASASNSLNQQYTDTKDAVNQQVAQTQENAQQALTQTEQDLAAAQVRQAQKLADLTAQQQQALLEEQAKIDTELNKAQQDFEAQKQAALAEQEKVNNGLKNTQQNVETFSEQIVAVPASVANTAQAAATEEVLVLEQTTVKEEKVAPTSEKIITQEETHYDLDKQEAVIDDRVSSMQETLVAKLNKVEGVNVYFRKGQIDAIDIDSNVIFQDDNITFSRQGKEVLEDVYNLMLLSKEPTFVLLPPGAYTDEVDLQGVRQAVALNSYLINKGLSSAKLNFNMGLVNEQPPAKFSNLEGVSIVFDYDNKPTLYNKVSDKNSYPILSLGMYPEKINTSLGEVMVIDYSVIETAAPIEEWKLQIIQHASDGKYYIVRQISSNKAIYDQVYWNGKKQFWGAALPDGKYTLMLRAKDTKGREKIVRRKVELISDTKKEEAKVKETKVSNVAKQTVLDYSTPRLWTKPAKILRKQSAVEDIQISEQVSIEETSSNTGLSTTTTTTTTTTTSSATKTTTTKNGVVNPSASPEQEGLAYDPSLEELI